MSALGFVPLALGLLTFLIAGRLGRRLPPAAIVRLGTVLALTIAVMTGLVLCVAGVLSLRTLEAAGRRSGHLGRGLPTMTSTVAGGLAALVVFGLLASAARCFLRSARALLQASVDSRRLGPIHSGLIVVDDEMPTAFAVAGVPGHVVVSTAMLHALDAQERQVLLAHEAAHLRHHHHLYVQLAQLAAAANPLLRRLSRVIATNTERWADEVAAAEVGSRDLVVRGLARAALARHAHARAEASCARGWVTEPGNLSAALGATDGQLADRLRLLLAPEPQKASLVSAFVVAVAIACGVTGMTAALQGHQQIERLEFSSSTSASTLGH
ncbi:MAG TPA: M48 family metalloprotease [Frankiaceae bacterium]|nr:M48 family metalloprotease [Frankiaceae bacterium]